MMEFLSEEFQKRLAGDVKEKYGKPCMIIIDEAHRWLGAQNQKILAWLSYHRHMGQKVLLITQKSTMLHFTYRALVAHEVRAKSSIFKWFLYQRIENGEGTGVFPCAKKKEVFQSYKSFQIKEHKTINYVYPVILFVVVMAGWWYFRPVKGEEKVEKKAVVGKVENVKPAVENYKKGFLGYSSDKVPEKLIP